MTESAASQYNSRERAGLLGMGHQLNMQDVMQELNPNFKDRRLKDHHATPKNRAEVIEHLSEHHGENHPAKTTTRELYTQHLQRHRDGWHGGHTH